MVVLTTLSYDQLGYLIQNRQIDLDNADLIFGKPSEQIKTYMTSRLGSEGYVMGVRGKINKNSVGLLSQLDKDLNGNKIVLEFNADDDDVLSFDVNGLEEALEIMTYGLPQELLYEQLDKSILSEHRQKGVEIVCVPSVYKTSNMRITSLSREIEIDVDGITFVKLKE